MSTLTVFMSVGCAGSKMTFGVELLRSETGSARTAVSFIISRTKTHLGDFSCGCRYKNNSTEWICKRIHFVMVVLIFANKSFVLMLLFV